LEVCWRQEKLCSNITKGPGGRECPASGERGSVIRKRRWTAWAAVHEDRKGILLHVPKVSPVRRGFNLWCYFEKIFEKVFHNSTTLCSDTVPPRTLRARSFVLQDQTKLDHYKGTISVFLSRNCLVFSNIFFGKSLQLSAIGCTSLANHSIKHQNVLALLRKSVRMLMNPRLLILFHTLPTDLGDPGGIMTFPPCTCVDWKNKNQCLR
jgi:hypothetical protein